MQYDARTKEIKSILVNSDNIKSYFSTKSYINSEIEKDRISKLYKKSMLAPKQSHSSNVLLSTDQLYPTTGEYDAVVTNNREIVISVSTADCVPILYADRHAGIIAVSHQGWRGTLKELPSKVLKTMVSVGAKKENITVAIGPAIGPCCYEIYGDRLALFRETFPKYMKKVLLENRKKIYLNLAHLNYLLLNESGLKTEQIDLGLYCTKCDSQRFYSYQRGDIDKSRRMISLITIQKQIR